MDLQGKISSRDKYMPCLLTRLCDRDPHNAADQEIRGISIQRLKEDVFRNIEMILNSHSRMSDEELHHDEEILTSVLALGLEDFCGCSHSPKKRDELLQQIRFQIQTFEPRLDPDSIEVNLVENVGEDHRSELEMEVKGRIRAVEIDEAIVFRSILELESGNVMVSRKTGR